MAAADTAASTIIMLTTEDVREFFQRKLLIRQAQRDCARRNEVRLQPKGNLYALDYLRNLARALVAWIG